MLLDQPDFECDPTTRSDGDTPLHTVIRWINAEPASQRQYGNALVEMMLEAGSNTRVRNKGRLTPLQLVDPRNVALRQLIQKHEYAVTNAGDFVSEQPGGKEKKDKKYAQTGPVSQDDDAEFSGSDEEEKAEWERRRKVGKR